jgi:rare lipoprotein A
MDAGCRRFAGLAAVVLLAACARAVVPGPPAPPAQTPPAQGPAVQAPPAQPPRKSPPPVEHSGLASWYGKAHQGKRTASGEVYDMGDFTAAHRTLPIGTRLMVTNLDNGQAVEVRVNDRGPFLASRVLDLSYGAARALGGLGSGVIRVKFRVIAAPDGAPVASAPASSGGFSVQVGAFASRTRAEGVRQALEREGSKATVSETVAGDETFYQVRVGPYAGREAAEAEARRLADRGYLAVVVTDR